MMSRPGLVLVALSLALVRPAPADAFPAAVRHGYVNCTACHHSPAGGGVLTPYGRQLSRELLATWGGGEREASFAYGAVRTPSWLTLGAQIRGGLLSSRQPSNFAWEKADIEAVARIRRWTMTGSLGRQIRDEPADRADAWISRRHYVQYEVRRELAVRAGRFFPSLGVYQGDAARLSDREIGTEPGRETYNVEANWISDRWSGSVTAILGRSDSGGRARSRGWAVSASLPVGPRAKVGMTLLGRSDEQWARRAIGAHALVGVSSRVYFIGQGFLQQVRAEGAVEGGSWAVVHHQRLGIEVLRGLSLFAVNEAAHGDNGSLRGPRRRSGVGAQWLARPSLEIQAQALDVQPAGGARAPQLSLTFGFYP